jgi:hypothetical protein
VGYALLYFPGTADPDEAVPIAVAEGEERSGVDLTFRLIRTVTIEGRVVNEAGALPPTNLTLVRTGPRVQPRDLVISASNSSQANPSGAFRFAAVTPGRYRLTARAFVTPPVLPATPEPPGVGAASINVGPLWATAEIVVADDDISGLAVTLRPGMRVTGRVSFDARSSMQPPDPMTVRVSLVDVDGGTARPSGAVRSNGTFEINGILPGAYVLTSPLTEQGWWLRSVTAGGRDILDFPLELNGGDISGVNVTFTDRHTELTGMLQTASNRAAPEHFIVVMPADRALWRRFSRRVQATRPNTEGRFLFRDLPSGDYLLAALTDLEPSDLVDLAFLEQVAGAGVAVRLIDGEQRTQDLRLARIP